MRPHVAGPWTEVVERRAETPADHEHEWVYDHTHDDWYDGDSDDYYKCTICGKVDVRYVPR